ncbi:MAG: PTS transporter subunit EIIC [Ignavibacteriales bacterium]
MDYKQIAEQIISALGHPGNITGLEYCMTRLRIEVRDEGKTDIERIRKTDGVIDVLGKGRSLQVVLGPGTAQGVAGALAGMPGVNLKIVEESAVSDTPRGKGQVLQSFSEIFTPLIPALIGSGLVAGLGKLLQSLGVSADLGFMKALNIVGLAFYGFIVILVAMNTARVNGGSPILGAVAGSILINPALSGLGIVPGRGGIIGAMLAGALMAYVEKNVRKATPSALKVHLPPAVSVLVSGFVIVYLLQPAAGFAADLLVNTVLSLLKIGGALAGACISALFLPLVMTGLHHGLTPVHLELIKQVGYSQLQTMNSMAGAGQVGAALAIYLRYRKSRGLAETIKGALPVGVLGIGEPLIYGVTMPLGKPFVTACLGAAAGGAFVGAVGLGARGVYVSGILGIVIATNPVQYVIAYLLAAGAGFVLTYMTPVASEVVASVDRLTSSKSQVG